MAISQIITDLPTPPQSTDPINFAVRADAFVQALDDLQGEINTWAGQANTTQTQINATQTDVEGLKDDVIDLKQDVIDLNAAHTVEVEALKQDVIDIKDETITYMNASMMAVNFKGAFIVGTTNALLGEMWSYGGVIWLCLENTSETPSDVSTKWMINSVGTLSDFTTALGF